MFLEFDTWDTEMRAPFKRFNGFGNYILQTWESFVNNEHITCILEIRHGRGLTIILPRMRNAAQLLLSLNTSRVLLILLGARVSIPLATSSATFFSHESHHLNDLVGLTRQKCTTLNKDYYPFFDNGAHCIFTGFVTGTSPEPRRVLPERTHNQSIGLHSRADCKHFFLAPVIQ